MDFDDADIRAGRQVVQDVASLGYHLFGKALDRKAASALLVDITALRSFDDGVFLEEAAFDAAPPATGVDPAPGHNLLERFADRLRFIEGDPLIIAGLSALLGKGYEFLDKRLVCSLPAAVIPDWVKRRLHDDPTTPLGAYARPDRRDVAYLHQADFHQDLSDYGDREADFVTLQVHLHSVARHDSPLLLMENSHRLGAVAFPHRLIPEWDGVWTYRDGRGQEVRTRQTMLVGATGWAGLWHPCTLNGAQPDPADRPRISLRYICAKRPGVFAGLDRVNDTLQGPLSLTPREEVAVAAAGAA